MLINEVASLGLARIMSEFSIIAAYTKTAIDGLSKQISALGEGLQNAAPEKAGVPNKSVQYLLKIAEILAKLAEDCNKFLPPPPSQNSPPKP